MEGNYSVLFGNQAAGKVQVLRQGLYYWFHCRCQLTGAVICRLYALWEGHRENLGVLIPMGEGFGLDTKVPVKRFPEGEVRFAIGPKGETSSPLFYPIVPEEPFAYIQRLKDGFLTYQQGQPGLGIHREILSSRPTGQ